MNRREAVAVMSLSALAALARSIGAVNGVHRVLKWHMAGEDGEQARFIGWMDANRNLHVAVIDTWIPPMNDFVPDISGAKKLALAPRQWPYKSYTIHSPEGELKVNDPDQRYTDYAERIEFHQPVGEDGPLNADYIKTNIKDEDFESLWAVAEMIAPGEDCHSTIAHYLGAK